MVHKLIAACCGLALAATAAWAGWPDTGKYAGISYIGPGDVLPGAGAWYGLRAYNLAYAISKGNAIIVRRASDNTTQTITVTTTGALNIAAANTFAGTDATCTGSASASSSLVLTGCSSTPTAGDTLTSTGGTGSFTQPAYIASCGTFSGGAGTCTLNAAQTVSGVTVTARVGLFITQLYDQTGNGNNVTQSTHADQAELLPSCTSSLPCMLFSGSQGYTGTCLQSTSSTGAFVQLAVAERTGNFSNDNTVFAICDNSSAGDTMGFSNSANTAFAFNNGASITATVADSAPHVLIDWLPNLNPVNVTFFEINSTLYADGSAAANGFAGQSVGGSLEDLGGLENTNGLTGYIWEAGYWHSNMTTRIADNLCINDNVYWFGKTLACTGTPTSYTATTGPCDLTACVEAYSLARAMINSYTGPLFELYNFNTSPANYLEVEQNPATRQANLSTWSSYCGGSAANCVITRIYSQINTTGNYLTAKGVDSSPTLHAGLFSIEAATGFALLTTSDTNDGANSGSYRIDAPGNVGTGGPFLGFTAGTHDVSVVYNGKFPNATDTCCGMFGPVDGNGSSTGANFSITTFFGDSNPAGSHQDCGTSSTYCLGIDAEGDGSAPDKADVGTSQINIIATIDHTLNPTERVDIFYNGHSLYTAAPPNVPVDLLTPSYFHFSAGGGGDTPAPVIFREGFVTNSILSASTQAAILSNEKTFYSGLSFP